MTNTAYIPESHFSGPLIDGRQVHLKLVESAAGPGLGRVVVRGEFARSDEATANGRIYSRSLWEAQIRRLSESMGEMKVLGELDHPDDGRTLLQRVSHVVTGLSLDPTGILIGEAIILDTQRGKDLKAMLQAGCKVGVSSRGFGTTRPHPALEGKEIVAEDYQLDTFDFVAQPADQHAFPKVFGESFVKTHTDCLYEGYKMTTKKKDGGPSEATTEQVLDLAGQARGQVEEQVRQELLKDPKVAGAKTTLEAVGKILTPYLLPENIQSLMEEKDQEITRLKGALAEAQKVNEEAEPRRKVLEDKLRVASYKLFVEQKTRSMPRSEATEIKKAVGPVENYSTAAALRSKMEESQKLIADRKAQALKERQERERQERAIEEARQMERSAAAARERELEERTAKLAEATQKLVSVVETQRLALYIERRLANNPQRARLSKVIEANNPSSEEAVDAIIEANTGRVNDSEAAQNVRTRVRQFYGSQGGRSVPASYEETSRRGRAMSEAMDDLPIDTAEFDHLAGLSEDRSPRRR